MKINKTVLAAAAIVLPLSVGIGSALSYFTANDSAAGGYAIEVGPPETEIEENFSSWEKKITITNTGDVPVYVRARAYVVSPYTIVSNLGSNWRNGNEGNDGKNGYFGYYYYNPALKARVKNEDGSYTYDKTEELKLKIDGIPTTDLVENEEFDVVVVYEKTSAVKVENGKVVPDWDFALKIEDADKLKSEKGGNNQ